MASPAWNAQQGAYTVASPHTPGGKVYFNPTSGQTYYIGSNGQPQAAGNDAAWNNVFAGVKSQAPGSTDLGTKNVNGQNVDLLQSPQGAYYYQQGGKNYALNTQQQQDLQLPQVAGYDQAGNAYYSPYDASTMGPNAPTAEANALKEIQKNDPKTYNAIQNLSGYYGQMGDALKSGGTIATPQIQQAARAAQVARGNYLGTAQASQEAMSTGLEGQQEAQNLGSYLNSGTTPQSMGSRQLSDDINQFSAANQGTPFQSTYSPQNTYTYLNPNAGAQFAQGANNYLNSANQQYGMSSPGLSPGASAGAGALSGAASGAMAGSTFGPYGTVIGGLGGAVVGGLGGYMGSKR